MTNKILAFSHIPKNAGSFFTYLLRSYYGTDHCRAISADGIYSYADLISDSRIYPALRAISGHELRPYVDFREYEERFVWAVLIRDPYHRFPSQYKWWCKRHNSTISFEDWCLLKGEKFSDFQCRWICGEADHEKAMEVINKKNIIIGFQDDLEAFVSSIVYTMQLNGFPWSNNLVINGSERNVGHFASEFIEKYNAEDIALYQKLLYEKSRYKPHTSPKLSANKINKANYYLNAFKHRVIYDSYKRFIAW
jgi:hypothetical protein